MSSQHLLQLAETLPRLIPGAVQLKCVFDYNLLWHQSNVSNPLQCIMLPGKPAEGEGIVWKLQCSWFEPQVAARPQHETEVLVQPCPRMRSFAVPPQSQPLIHHIENVHQLRHRRRSTFHLLQRRCRLLSFCRCRLPTLHGKALHKDGVCRGGRILAVIAARQAAEAPYGERGRALQLPPHRVCQQHLQMVDSSESFGDTQAWGPTGALVLDLDAVATFPDRQMRSKES